MMTRGSARSNWVVFPGTAILSGKAVRLTVGRLEPGKTGRPSALASDGDLVLLVSLGRRRLMLSREHLTRNVPTVQPNSPAISPGLSPRATMGGISSGSIFLDRAGFC